MRKFLTSFIAIIMSVSLIGCGSSEDTSGSYGSSGDKPAAEETTLEKVKREGYVTIGFANEIPYAYATPDGKLSGEAVEVARTVLQNMGITEMQGVLTEFGSLIPGLKAKRFDMITAGMYITPERAKEVAFADPEYSIGEGLAVQPGNPLDLHSYQDIIDNPEVKVAVMGGAIEYDYLTKMGISKDQIVIVPDNPAALDAVKSGRADATTMTGPSLQALLDASQDAKVERVMDFEQPVIDGVSVRGYGATAFRPEDQDFVDAFNAELQKLKDSGQLLEIISEFGFTEQELPGDTTAEDLINQ
jgi:polar amino acid transport system substrate-binding protein